MANGEPRMCLSENRMCFREPDGELYVGILFVRKLLILLEKIIERT